MEQISGFPRRHLKTRTIDSGFPENFAFSKEFWFALVIYVVSHRRISRRTCMILLGFGISWPHCFLLCRQEIIQPYLYISSSNLFIQRNPNNDVQMNNGLSFLFFFKVGVIWLLFFIKKTQNKSKTKETEPLNTVFLIQRLRRTG